MESASIAADTVSEPARTIPRATVLGVLVAAVVYIASTFAVMGVLSPATLTQSTAPYADAASAMWGGWAAYAIAAGAAIACFGALNGWILLQGQLPLAVARDGLFPGAFGRVSRRGTPATGLVISSVVVTGLVLMNFTRGLVELFTFFILLATLNTLAPYIMTTLSALILMARDDGPFRAGRVSAATIALLALLYALWAVAGLGADTLYWGLLLLLAGVPVYAWVRRRRRYTMPS